MGKSSQVRYAEYFLHAIEANPEDWTWFNQEWPQIQRAWQWAERHQADELLLGYLRYFVPLQDRTGLWSEAVLWGQTGLRIMEDIAEQSFRSRILCNLGIAHYRLGNHEDALTLLNEALALVGIEQDRANELNIRNNLGLVQVERNNPEQAILQYEQLLQEADVRDDPEKLALVLSNLGSVRNRLGQGQRTLDLYEQALGIASTSSNPEVKVVIFQHVTKLYFQLGRLDDAQNLAEQALSIAQQVGDKVAESLLLVERGEIILDNALGDLLENNADDRPLTLEQVQDAQHDFETSLQIQRELTNPPNLGDTLLSLGRLFYMCAEMERAYTYFSEAIHIFKQAEKWADTANALNNLALVYRFQEDFEAVLRVAQDAVTLYQRIGNLRNLRLSIQFVAEAYIELERTDEAILTYKSGLSTAEQIGATDIQAELLTRLAFLTSDLEQFTDSIYYHKQALQLWQELDEPVEQIGLLNSAGELYYECHQYDDAHGSFLDALLIAQESEQIEGRELLHLNAATSIDVIGGLTQAYYHYEQALQFAHETQNREHERTIRWTLAVSYEDAERYEDALNQMYRVVDLDRQLEHPDLDADLELVAELKMLHLDSTARK